MLVQPPKNCAAHKCVKYRAPAASRSTAANSTTRISLAYMIAHTFCQWRILAPIRMFNPFFLNVIFNPWYSHDTTCVGTDHNSSSQPCQLPTSMANIPYLAKSSKDKSSSRRSKRQGLRAERPARRSGSRSVVHCERISYP